MERKQEGVTLVMSNDDKGLETYGKGGNAVMSARGDS